ncbi:MAG TPA: ABC transporter ATP-binding protein [Tepidisphaeraceae bacterium]|jgi:lipopolysaccharide transport system ATP-binding protein|nr:ABC transporter ATP-binding protein [Tepidisphaeraceae bacterium]
MSSEQSKSGEGKPAVVVARNLTKTYKLYDRPIDRLWEGLLGGKRHRAVHALKDISFTITPGECVGIVGANGAGKTTLLSVLAGTLAPSTGTVDIYGTSSAILGLGVGLLQDYTGRENIRYGLISRGTDPGRVAEKEDEIIDFAEAKDYVDNPLNTYSTGMVARLAFALAYAADPDILIVDEALSVGDARFVFKCQKRIKEFIDGGRTLLFISHDRTMVEQLCARAILLEKGQMLLDGPTKDVLDAYTKLYFGQQVTPQGNVSTPKEYGYEGAGLVRVELPDAGRVAEDVWDTRQGDILRMRVTARIDKRIEKLAIGCAVYNGFRQKLCGFSTVNYGEPLEVVEPGEMTFEFRIPLYMPAGAYVVEIVLADLATDPPTLLHTWSEAVKFHVRWAGYSIAGIHDGGAEVEFQGKVYSNAIEKARRVKLGSGE